MTKEHSAEAPMKSNTLQAFGYFNLHWQNKTKQDKQDKDIDIKYSEKQ